MARWVMLLLATTITSAVVATGHSALLTWLSGMGATVGPVDVAKSALGMGSGLVLSRDVEAGELLFSIPRTATIGLETALADARLGESLLAVQEVESDRAAIAGYLAHQILNAADSDFMQYVSTLPSRTDAGETHALWWSDAEVALLSGTCAHVELLSLMKEVDEVTEVLRASALLDDVERHGASAVGAAVRAAYVALLSRAFGSGEQRGGEELGQVLIPMLDMLQHGSSATVTYEVSGDNDEMICARALGPQPAQTELVLCYGDHPDFVFGMHFGFVPMLLEQRASCYTVLQLEAVGEGLGFGLGDPIALRAQLAADELREARGEEEIRRSKEETAESTSSQGGMEWLEATVRADPAAALAEMLSWAPGMASEYPLEFGVSVEALDALSGVLCLDSRGAAADAMDASDDDAESGSGGLDALAACARLCALRDGGGDETVERQRAAALLQLVLSGSISAPNDIDAAWLVTVAARQQLVALELAGASVEEASQASVKQVVRPACVEMARSIRRSEELVLRRICESDDVGVLFQVSGWSAAARAAGL